MGITGIDGIVYGVSDLSACRAFFTDWGLTAGQCDGDRAVFATRDGSEVILRSESATDLPPAIQPGSTIREIIWGVESSADLDRIGLELARDRAVIRDQDGILHAADDLGLGIAFRQTRRTTVPDQRLPMNSLTSPQRINTRATYHDRARPTHIGHCVFMAPDIGRLEKFYTERLGFHVSDYYKGRGVFLRSAARGGHHNLFYLESADGEAAINHVAFGVEDIHELFAGGLYVQDRGHDVQIGPGRHHISSCYFWYFNCPAGGATEYFCDEDFLTESWTPGYWDPAPETFAEWTLANGLKRSAALPPTREERDKKFREQPDVRARADAAHS